MFAVGTTSSNLPYNTKSSLQALLKTRRQILNEREKLSLKFNEEQLMQGFLSAENKNITHFKANGIVNEHTSDTSSSVTSDLGDVDQNEDFTYSQKLFHIADGNLYSIFSPLQGRSYGMKPSFLRKQKCTVQECRGRGRKVLRKGLKFHNFLPSESVTSEKGITLLDDQWKVHSECKLREEHGTKQITVSNWFHSIKQPVDDDSKQTETKSQELFCSNDKTAETNLKEEKNENIAYEEHDKTLSYAATTMVRDPDVPSNNHVPLSNQDIFKYPDIPALRVPSKPKTEKSSFLNNLLTVASSQVPPVSSSPDSELKVHRRIVLRNGQKRRRKPEQTRRIVPYTKYLSIMEETETGPLDLSFHSNNAQFSPVNQYPNDVYEASMKCSITNGILTMPSASKKSSQYPVEKRDCQTPGEKFPQTETNNGSYRHRAPPCYSNASPYCYSLPFNEKPGETMPSPTALNSILGVPKPSFFTPNPLPHSSLVSGTRKETAFKYGTTSLPNKVDYAKHYEMSKAAANTKPRKKSQRSVIKQKLEDTFKQNGFLVKTKQVSDGEATFCKFRQLRKFTRYYVKSYAQHLPEEHKMWKGFLPPKTVLPPISGIVSNTTDKTTT